MMALDQSFIELNRASTRRLNDLITYLTKEQLLTPVGEHWTVSTALVHLAFWDLRVLHLLDQTKRGLEIPQGDIDIVNDISLQIWSAVPSHEAVRLVLQNAEAVDSELENLDPVLLEKIYQINQRYIHRHLHRNLHLDDIQSVIKP